MGKQQGRVPGGLHMGNVHRGIGRVHIGRNDTKDHNCQNGSNGAKGDQTKGVIAGVFVASDGGHTDTKCHDKGHRYGACGNAAGVKGYRHKIIRRKK